MEVLAYFNEKNKQEYEFIQRISYDYANDPDTPVSQKEEIDDYWNKFKAETGIPSACTSSCPLGH